MKNQLIAWFGTTFLVSTGIGVYFRKNIYTFIKVINISSDILNIVREGIEDSSDDKLTPDEIQKITTLVVKLKQDIKGASK